MKTNTYIHISFDELCREIKEEKGYDIASKFYERYAPSSDCSVRVWIPTAGELALYDYEKWERVMFDFLNDNGFAFGTDLYVDINY